MSRSKIQLSWLDRAIGVVSPGTALRRGAARAVMAAASGYDGARRDRSATKGWGAAVSSSADRDTLPDLDVLRARSRDLVRNDPLARSAVTTKVAHVIGSGHLVSPEIDGAALRLSEDQAEAWELRALAVWNDWAQSTDCDVTRHQTFAELEDLVYRSRLQSGDVFVIRRFKQRRGRLLATALQVVEADRLSNPNWAADSDQIAGGVEFDADGAAVAYHFADRHVLDRGLSGTPKWTRVPAYDAQGRKLVLHIHGPRERPDMTRYAPMLAPVIESLKQRSRYTAAELMAAVVSAIFAVTTESEDGDLSDSLMRLATQVAGGSNTSTSKMAEIDLTEPGVVFDLLPGEKINSFTPGRPNPEFEPFIMAVAREVGAGTDLPYELLVKQFQASYSASRAAMEMAWLFMRTDRALHVTQFCQPIYEDVITEAVARGILAAPGLLSDPLIRRAWLGAVWMGPARPTIDPVKDAKADREYLDMGATSLTRIVAERFGQDVRSVRKRRDSDGSNEIGQRGQAPAEMTAPANDDTPDSDLET